MMKKIALPAILGLAFAAHAAEFELDPHHTNARFAIDHFGTTTNTGGFYNLEGTLTFDAEAGTGAVEVVIPVKNLAPAWKALITI